MDIRMAVLCQRVVQARYAFVIHTTNPSTGDEGEIYAEAVLGLGEAIVSGMVPGSALAFVAKKDDLDNPKVRPRSKFNITFLIYVLWSLFIGWTSTVTPLPLPRQPLLCLIPRSRLPLLPNRSCRTRARARACLCATRSSSDQTPTERTWRGASWIEQLLYRYMFLC